MLKNPTIFYSLIGCIVLIFFYGCSEDENGSLVFEMSNFTSIDRVDTLEVDSSRGIYILGLVRNYPIGEFSYDLGLVKQLENGKQLFYEAKINPNILRISKEYLAFVDKEHGFSNIGWYYVKNGQVQDSLSGLHEISDSIKRIVSKDANVVENRGDIDAYFGVNRKKNFKYGDFVLTNKTLFPENLEYGLYILDKGTLKRVSKNAEDIYQKVDGTFYVPAPGLGITNKWNKRKIFQVLDSVSGSTKAPIKFIIDDELDQ